MIFDLELAFYGKSADDVIREYEEGMEDSASKNKVMVYT
jgi:hypothetical protein